MNRHRLAAPLVLLPALTLAASLAHGFNSGSTGADGAFAPTADVTVTLPASGVLNYTTVDIPSGVSVRFAPSSNAPVVLLASGAVNIAGTIDIRGGAGGGGGHPGRQGRARRL